MDRFQIASSVGSVGSVVVALILETLRKRGGIISTPSACYAAVAGVICVVRGKKTNEELVALPAGVGNKVLPLGRLVLRALREPRSVPSGGVHCPAVEAFGAKEAWASDKFPMVW